MSGLREKCFTDFTDAAELINFRVMADGTLERREGSETSVSFSQNPRAYFVYDDTIYVVCDKVLFACQDNSPSYVGRMRNCTFASADERMAVFEYGGIIHLIGGGAYYTYDVKNDDFSENTCYAPLLRYTDEETGEHISNEVVNQIGHKARMHFIQGEASSYYLDGIAASVDEVLCDGEPFTAYTLVQNGNFSFIQFETDSNITRYKDILVTYTLSSDYHVGMKDLILKNKKAFVHKAEDGVRLFLYDPDDPLGTVYYSESSYDMEGVRRPTFDYFTELSFFNVGDGASPLYEMAYLNDHVLILSGSVTYELTSEKATTETGHNTSVFGSKMITNERGISKDSGALLIDSYLYLMTPFGLYRYSYNKFTYDFIMTNIEIPKRVLPDRRRYADVRLFHYRSNDELWLCCDTDIAVYNLRIKKWYSFTGFPTEKLFTILGICGYFNETELYTFNSDADLDGDTPFTAVCETEWYAPDTPFSSKTIYTFGAVFDNKAGAQLNCKISSDRGTSLDLTFTPDPDVSISPCVARSHARLPRSGHIICRLESASGKPAVNIRGVFIRYRDLGGKQ